VFSDRRDKMSGRKCCAMKFSIIVVCLNSGEKLNQTLDSILAQTYQDYEIVVKDGGSKDGSIEQIRQDERIQLYVEKDAGIYDAMNQAVAYAGGDFILFLNCGDVFYNSKVLEEVAGYVGQITNARHNNLVLYGDTYSEKNDVVIAAAPQITGFTCYRNIPCHQSCFYATALCKKKPYDAQYRIRADYDHFLWCYYRAQATMLHTGLIISSYEGGGFSESKENQKRDREEHRSITEQYMSRRELLQYRMTMLITLAPLRKMVAESKVFSGAYHWLKKCLYRK